MEEVVIDLNQNLLQIEGDTPVMLSRASRIIYAINTGFQPVTWLMLLACRLCSKQQANTEAQCRRIYAIKKLNEGFYQALNYGFVPIYLVAFIRDLIHWSQSENRLGYPGSFPLWPTQFSDTYWTGSMTSFDQLAWRGRAVALYTPIFYALIYSFIAWQGFHFNRRELNHEGQLNWAALYRERLQRHQQPIINSLYYRRRCDVLASVLIQLDDLNDEQRQMAIKELLIAAEMPNNVQIKYLVKQKAFALLYELVHQRYEQWKDLDAPQRPILASAIQALNKSAYFHWQLHPHISRHLPIFGIRQLAASYRTALYSWLLFHSLWQVLNWYINRADCDLHFAYVYSQAAYQCAACPDWQHEVNIAALNDIYTCVQSRLEHPHGVTTYQEALQRGAQLSPRGAAWDLDLSVLPWENYDSNDWEILKSGLISLFDSANSRTLRHLNLRGQGRLLNGLDEKLSWLIPRVNQSLDLSGLDLSGLDLSGLDLSGPNLLNFSASLRVLNLANTQMQDDTAQALFSAINQTQLVDLDLTAFEISEPAADIMRDVFNYKNFQRMILAEVKFRLDAGDAWLSGLTKSNLTELNLNSVMISPSMFQSLKTLLQNGLKKLSLANSNLVGIDLMECMQALSESELSELDLSYWFLESYLITELVQGRLLQSLTKLNLSHVSFGFGAVDALVSAFNDSPTHSTLSHLDVSDASLLAEDFVALAQILNATQLTHMNLSRSAQDGVDWQAFAEPIFASQAQAVLYLGLQGNNLDGPSLQAMLNFSSNSSRPLAIDLSKNQLNTGAVLALTQLVSEKKLHELDLSDNPLCASDWETLIAVLGESSLEKLGAAGSGLTAANAVALAKNLDRSSLSALDLSRNSIGTTGTVALMRALYDEKLPRPNELMADAPSIDWRHHLSSVPLVRQSFQLELNQANLTDDAGQALCMSQYGFFSQGAQLDLSLQGNAFEEVDPFSCGIANSAANISLHVTFLTVMLYILMQGMSTSVGSYKLY